MAGYSKRPLVEKLGIREGFRIGIVCPPRSYASIVGKLPRNVMVVKLAPSRDTLPLDFIHLFAATKGDLEDVLPDLKRRLSPKGMLWVSWPKLSSKVKTDLNENLVRALALRNGLVDVKVCAVDDVWSGLKLVYRVKDRPQ